MAGIDSILLGKGYFEGFDKDWAESNNENYAIKWYSLFWYKAAKKLKSNEGIEEDDELLPSCVEDVRASIDVDGDGDIRFFFCFNIFTSSLAWIQNMKEAVLVYFSYFFC